MEPKTILITDLRTRAARDAADDLRTAGYNVVCVPESVCLWQEASLEAFAGPLAPTLYAVLHPAPPITQCGFEEVTEEQFARARDEGPLAAWCVAKVLGGILREKGTGIMIFLGSIHAEKPVGRGFLYSAGCGAVQMLQREFNQDYGTCGVRSYYIQRGVFRGDPDAKSDVSEFYFGQDLRMPERKLPEQGSLNGLIRFLLTPEAAILSGSDLRADGGLVMYYGERGTPQNRKGRQSNEQG